MDMTLTKPSRIDIQIQGERGTHRSKRASKKVKTGIAGCIAAA
jgi:hypothetical protein